MGRLPIILGSVVLLLLPACGTPQVLKDLSAAQLDAQVAVKGQLESYFQVMERFVEAKINEAAQRLDQLNEGILTSERKKFIITEPGSDGKVDMEALVNLTDSVERHNEFLITQKARLQQRLTTLRAKHKEFLDAYATLITAQKTLDEYVRLEKADEKVANELLSAVGISREQASDAIDGLASAASAIDKSLAKL